MNDERLSLRVSKETKDKLYAIQYKTRKAGKKKSFGQIITELLENDWVELIIDDEEPVLMKLADN